MTPQQFVGLAVRLFSIWLVFIALQLIAIMQAMNALSKGGGGSALYAVPALAALIAVALWNFPMTIAHRLVPRTHETNLLHMPAREATAAAAAIIGIWVIIGATPHVVTAIGMALISGGGREFGLYFTGERTLEFTAIAAQLGLGLFLVGKPWFVAHRVFPCVGAQQSSPPS